MWCHVPSCPPSEVKGPRGRQRKEVLRLGADSEALFLAVGLHPRPWRRKWSHIMACKVLPGTLKGN